MRITQLLRRCARRRCDTRVRFTDAAYREGLIGDPSRDGRTSIEVNMRRPQDINVRLETAEQILYQGTIQKRRGWN